MVWGCFMAHTTGPLTFIDVKMNAEVYQNILRDELMPFVESQGDPDNFVFQHDNDPKHTARSTNQFLNDSGLNVFQWPAQSPYINPIEHLWDELDRNIPHTARKNLESLRSGLVQTWSQIGPDVTNKLVASMKDRLLEVIKQKGWPTSY